MPPSEPRAEEACSSLEESSFELISNPGILSDDEGHTVSVASQSVDGDTADDFSSVDSNAGDTDDEEEEAETDDEQPRLHDDSSQLGESSSSRMTTFSADDIEDSGMTAKPAQLPFPRPADTAEHLYHPDTAEHTGLPGTSEEYLKHLLRKRSISPTRDQKAPVSKKSGPSSSPSKSGLWANIKAKAASYRVTPAARTLGRVLSLPWLWIIVLAILNITAIYGATSYFNRVSSDPRASTVQTMINQRWSIRSTNSATIPSRVLTANPTATPARTWTDFDRKAEMEKMRKQFRGEMAWEFEQMSADRVRQELAKAEKDMDESFMNILTSALPQKPIGRALESSFSGGEGFRLLSYGGPNGFLIILPPSLRSKDPAISVTVTRKGSPVRIELAKLRRGLHYLQVAADDIHGNVDFEIRTVAKPFKYQRERIHLGSSWLPETIQPSKWAADAASKMVEVFRGDVLAPIEAATKEISVQVGDSISKTSKSLSHSSRKFVDSALQRLDDTAKSLMKLPQSTWANTVKVQHDILTAQKRLSCQISKQSTSVAKKIGYSTGVLQNGVEHAWAGVYTAVAHRFPQADLSLPLTDPAKALKNAQANVQDIFGKLKKSEKKRAAKQERKGRKQQVRAERKERRKAGRR